MLKPFSCIFRPKRAHTIAFAALVVLLQCPLKAYGLTYDYFGLGTLGGSVAWSSAINEGGSVVGSSYRTANRPYHAVLWNSNRPMDLGTLGGSYSSAYSINVNGQIVGSSFTSGDTANHATLWNGTTKTDLGGIGGFGFGSVAHSINNSGQIVGVSNFAELGKLYNHATLWENGVVVDLDTLGGTNSKATAINSSGLIVGSSHLVHDTATRATKWLDGTPYDLGTLGGRDSVALGVNDKGSIVGNSDTGNGSFRASLWKGNSIVDLGTLGGTNSTAADINNFGWIVGTSNMVGNTASHATLWQGSMAIDLNKLLDSSLAQAGWILVDAFSINDSGSITGTALNSLNGQQQAYVLTVSSIPEPSVLAMFLLGLSILFAWCRSSTQIPGNGLTRAQPG